MAKQANQMTASGVSIDNKPLTIPWVFGAGQSKAG